MPAHRHDTHPTVAGATTPTRFRSPVGRAGIHGLAAGIALLLAGCGADADDPEPASDAVASTATEDTTPGAADWVDIDQLIRDDIADPFPEYAGSYSSEGETVINIMLVEEVSPERLAQLRQAIIDHHGNLERHHDAEVRTEIAEYSWAELDEARGVLRTVGHTGFQFVGIRDDINRVDIGILADGADATIASIREQLEARGDGDLFARMHFEQVAEPVTPSARVDERA